MIAIAAFLFARTAGILSIGEMTNVTNCRKTNTIPGVIPVPDTAIHAPITKIPSRIMTLAAVLVLGCTACENSGESAPAAESNTTVEADQPSEQPADDSAQEGLETPFSYTENTYAGPPDLFSASLDYSKTEMGQDKLLMAALKCVLFDRNPWGIIYLEVEQKQVEREIEDIAI